MQIGMQFPWEIIPGAGGSPGSVCIRERVTERKRSTSTAPLERIRTRVVEREPERSLTPPPPRFAGPGRRDKRKSVRTISITCSI